MITRASLLILGFASVCFSAFLTHSVAADKKDNTTSFVKSLITQSVFDFSRFDLFGNELPPPNLTLPRNHFLCAKAQMDSEEFRKFAGMLFIDASSGKFKRIEGETWNFWRMNEIKEAASDEEEDIIDLGNSDTRSVLDPRDIPNVSVVTDQARLAHYNRKSIITQLPIDSSISPERDLLAVNLLLLSIPGLKESWLDSRNDLAGILLLIFVHQVGRDLDMYPEEFEEFYEFCKAYSKGLIRLSSIDAPAEAIKNELFSLAIRNSLGYTLEVFYALELVDFGSERLFKFVLQTAMCPIVIQRFFDFVPWKRALEEEEEEGSLIARVHYLYAEYPEYLSMLFDYESSRIDWSVGDHLTGRTLLWKLLSSCQQSAFSDDARVRVYRGLLKSFLKNPNNAGIWTYRAGDGNSRDLFDECLAGEGEGLRLLSEYYNYAAESIGVTLDLLERIIATWRSSNTDTFVLTRTFKFLIRSCGDNNLQSLMPFLIEAFSLFQSRLPVVPKQRTLSTSSSSRSISGEFRRFFSRGSSSENLLSESTSNPNLSSLSSPRNSAVPMEMMKMIVERVKGMNLGKNDGGIKGIIEEWESIIQNHQ